MKKYLILGFFLVGMTCQGQVKNFSFHAMANYPIINTVESDQQALSIPIPAASGYTHYTSKASLRETFTSKVGFDIGTSLDYYLTPKFFITSGLSVSQIRYKRSVEVTLISPNVQVPNFPTTVGQPFGTTYGSITFRDAQGNVVLTPPSLPQRPETIGETTTLSLQAPVLIGTSFFNGKLEVRTGAVFSYLLHATQVKDEYSASTQSFAEYTDSSKDGFSEFQTGVTVQTTYLIGQHLGINFTARKFFTPIYKSEAQSAGEAKYNLLSLGLNYRL